MMTSGGKAKRKPGASVFRAAERWLLAWARRLHASARSCSGSRRCGRRSVAVRARARARARSSLPLPPAVPWLTRAHADPLAATTFAPARRARRRAAAAQSRASSACPTFSTGGTPTASTTRPLSSSSGSPSSTSRTPPSARPPRSTATPRSRSSCTRCRTSTRRAQVGRRRLPRGRVRARARVVRRALVRVERSRNNHFLFYRPVANLRAHYPRWERPTEAVKDPAMDFVNLARARVADAEALAPDEEHLYLSVNTPANATALRGLRAALARARRRARATTSRAEPAARARVGGRRALRATTSSSRATSPRRSRPTPTTSSCPRSRATRGSSAALACAAWRRGPLRGSRNMVAMLKGAKTASSRRRACPSSSTSSRQAPPVVPPLAHGLVDDSRHHGARGAVGARARRHRRARGRAGESVHPAVPGSTTSSR